MRPTGSPLVLNGYINVDANAEIYFQEGYDYDYPSPNM